MSAASQVMSIRQVQAAEKQFSFFAMIAAAFVVCCAASSRTIAGK